MGQDGIRYGLLCKANGLETEPAFHPSWIQSLNKNDVSFIKCIYIVMIPLIHI